ncbi:unnamed protein product [Lota lota]
MIARVITSANMAADQPKPGTLQWLAVPLPHSDASSEDALRCASVEGLEDLGPHVKRFQPSECGGKQVLTNGLPSDVMDGLKAALYTRACDLAGGVTRRSILLTSRTDRGEDLEGDVVVRSPRLRPDQSLKQDMTRYGACLHRHNALSEEGQTNAARACASIVPAVFGRRSRISGR